MSPSQILRCPKRALTPRKFVELLFAVASAFINPSRRCLFRRLRSALALGLAAFLFFAPLGFKVFAQQVASDSASVSRVPEGESFINYVDAKGDIVCRETTPVEHGELSKVDTSGQGMHQISPFTHQRDLKAQSSDTNNAETVPTKIVLRGTAQLENFPEAKAAFIRAALIWEAKIQSSLKIYIDVDYGPTRFGQPWPASNPLGTTSSYAGEYLYQNVRQSLIAGASMAAEASLYNSLPATSLPTDKGAASYITVSDAVARALGLMEPIASDTELAPRVSFNSVHQFDFDPSDGINADKYDFEAVAMHEIGHALGFISRAGRTDGAAPTLWDMFRFREGTTLDTFGTAERIMTAEGLQYYFSGGEDIALSTGGPNGQATGGDGIQSSHWKYSGWSYTGIMVAPLAAGVRRVLTFNDTNALNFFGYNMDPSGAPPPPPANDNFANAQELVGCTGSIDGTNLSAKQESGEPWHGAGGSSVWYKWKTISNGEVKFSTAGARTNFDSTVAISSGGDSLDSQTLINWDNGYENYSEVVFPVTAGTVYTILIDGYAGVEGNFVLNWTRSGCAPKANQSISFPPLTNKTYGDAPFNVSATASSGLPVSLSILSGPATITGNTVTITGAGAVVVRASQEGDANYNAAPNVDQSFTVSKATATLTLGNLNQTYDGSAKSATAATTPAAGLSGVAISYSQGGTPVAATRNAGSYTVRASLNNSNYQAADVTDTLVISKATPVITWNNPANITYGTALSTTQLNATASVPGTLTYAPAAGTMLNAGANQTLSVSFTPTDTSNYNSASKSVLINVLKADQTITFAALSNKSFGDAPFSLSASASSNLPVSFQVVSGPATLAGSMLSITGAGHVIVRSTQEGNANYNAVPEVVREFDVSKATATLALNNMSQTYNGLVKPVSIITNPVGLSGVVVTYNGSSDVPINAGNYTVVASISNDNYQAQSVTGTLVVVKATSIITWMHPADITSGTPLTGAQLNATANVPGIFTYNPPAGTILPVGIDMPLSVNFTPTDTTNYSVAQATVLLNVNPPTILLLTEDNSEQAIALDAVTWMRGPFSVTSTYLQGQANPTRIIIFAKDLNLAAGEDASVLIIEAADSRGGTYRLLVEAITTVPGFEWLAQLNIKLPQELAGAGDVWVSVQYHDKLSNKVLVVIKP